MEMNMQFLGKLPIPMEIKAQYPLTQEAAEIKRERDLIIRDIIAGKDSRLLLIIGPCSADREDAVLSYIERLRRLQDRVEDKIFIVPRIYTNKPRTTGSGYKGMLHSPDPGERPNLIKGVIAIRKLHMRALTEFGFSSADEMLYPENHRYPIEHWAQVKSGKEWNSYIPSWTPEGEASRQGQFMQQNMKKGLEERGGKLTNY